MAKCSDEIAVGEMATLEPELDLEPEAFRAALHKALSKVADELGPFFPKIRKEYSYLTNGQEASYDLVYQNFATLDLNWCVIYIMMKSKPWTKDPSQPFELGRIFLPLSSKETNPDEDVKSIEEDRANDG